ncbi:gb [Venturia nashicola]|uniref:Gb n=1 Tax=Venturia nashicola TaxID=86259 RepID=A0A4Z1NVB5_9PEZI|nr:gb [Venturia nashicola]
MDATTQLIKANARQLAVLGGILSDPNRRKEVNQRYAIQKLFPDASSRFHDALDKLEDDLAKAKAIMRRDLAALRAEKRKEAEAKEKKAQGLSISPEITKSASPETTSSTTVKVEPQDSAPETKSEEQTAKEPSPAPIPPPSEPIPASPNDKPEAETETTNLEENDASNAMDTFDIDDLFGDPGDNDNENENTVNSIDMTDFHSPSNDVPLLAGLESYANMPDTSLPESSGAGIPAGTSSAMENDNGGLDFSMLGIPETNVADDSNAGLGIDGLDGTDHGTMKEANGLEVSGDGLDGLGVVNLTEEEQKKQSGMDDAFWADLKTGDDNTFGDDGGMGDADNSFADLIGFNDDEQLDTGDDPFNWALDDN